MAFHQYPSSGLLKSAVCQTMFKEQKKIEYERKIMKKTCSAEKHW
jgi:hypothetical protein